VGNEPHIRKVNTVMEATMKYQFNDEVGMIRVMDTAVPASPVWQPQAPTLDTTATSNPYGDTLAAIAEMLRFHMVAFLWGIAVVMINLTALIWFTGVVVYQTIAHPIRWMLVNVQAAPENMDYPADAWSVR
jgi:hypothetical protein